MVPWRKGEDGGLLMLLALMVGADQDNISRNPGLKGGACDKSRLCATGLVEGRGSSQGVGVVNGGVRML